jgi:hypothetical protein
MIAEHLPLIDTYIPVYPLFTAFCAIPSLANPHPRQRLDTFAALVISAASGACQASCGILPRCRWSTP